MRPVHTDMLNYEAPDVVASKMKAWLDVTVNPCASRIVGAQLTYFPVPALYTNTDGIMDGKMIGYRVDPASGPSSLVVVGFPGGGEYVESFSELAHAVAAEGISFVAMAWPGTYNSYFEDGTLPTFDRLSQAAEAYFAPLVTKLKDDGAAQVVGFGMALGNRFARMAETRASLFDAVIVASAGDVFTGAFTGRPAELEVTWKNDTLSKEVRYAAWKELYFGPANQDVEIAGGFDRVTRACPVVSAPFAAAFMKGFIYTREEWTTTGGPGEVNGASPLLVIGGEYDIFAPLATNGDMYKSFSPDTVTLEVIEGGGRRLARH